MATFRSGVKIFGEISNRQGHKQFQLRSYSNDHRTILQRSPGCETLKSWTPLHSSRAWLSLFGREKPNENEVIQKETCDEKCPKCKSWLSLFKKSILKEKSLVSCNHTNEGQLGKRKDQKTLEEAQNSEGWKLEATSEAEVSKNHVICRTSLKQLVINKENVKRCTPNSEEQIPSTNSLNMTPSREKFRTPIALESPQSDTIYNLQPRKQFPFISNNKFTKELNFQPYNEYFKQSSKDTLPIEKVHAHNGFPTSGLHKTTVKQHNSSKNRSLQSLCKNSITVAEKQTPSKKTSLKYENTGFPQKINSEQKIIKSKLSQKSNEDYQVLLPSNTQPFINSSEAMQLQNTAISNNLTYVRKPIEQAQNKSLKSLTIKENDFYKEISFSNYANILEYGNKCMLKSKVSDSSESKKESNSTFSLLEAEVDSTLQSNKGNNIVICSSNTNIKSMRKEPIPFSYEKPYVQWYSIELDAQEETINEQICSPSKQIDANINVSLPESCMSTTCLTHFKKPPNQIVKRTFTSFIGDPSIPLYRSYKCQEVKSGNETKTPPSPDANKKEDSVLKEKKPKQKCDKRPAPGCKVPQSVDCKQKARTHPPCDIKPAPKPSYSECLRYPPPPHKFTECNLEKKSACPPEKKVISYDGCAKKSEKEELVCPEKPPEKKKEKVQKRKKAKTDECDTENDVCADAEPFKLKSVYSKPSLKCSSNQHYINEQKQPMQRSYSYMNLRTYQTSNYENPRSYNFIEPGSRKSSMECSSETSKSGLSTTDISGKRIDSGVKKEIKEDKTCEKHQVPGCKIAENTDCRHAMKGMPPCSRRLPPKPSYSECLRDRTPRPRFTECKVTKYDVCPDAKPKVKVYDGCQLKEEVNTIECPEEVSKEKENI